MKTLFYSPQSYKIAQEALNLLTIRKKCSVRQRMRCNLVARYCVQLFLIVEHI